MKITKTFVSIFLLTFLIGYLSVLPPKRVSVPTKISNATPKEIPAPPSEPRIEPEIFDVDFDFFNYEPQFGIDLVETGEGFHGDDIKAKSGETWLGLFKKNGKHQLRYTKIKIRRVHDPIVDGYEEKDAKQKTGKTVTVESKTKPLFLLKNAKTLREGKVTTLFRGLSIEEADETEQMTLLKQDFVQEFQLGERKYTFRVEEGLSRSKEKILVLVLETSKTSQIVHFIHYSEIGDYVGNLLWVGDLDRDGKLDLYMEFYGYEKGGYSSGLFLSSEAEKGKLVKEVAAFGTSGC